jgi:hypothetical protein
MTRRHELMLALKAQLQAAFPDADVGYWRDTKPRGRETVVNFRDTGATYARDNTQHDHSLRVEIDAYVFGDDLGLALNGTLEKLIGSVSDKPSLGHRAVLTDIEASGFDTVGDGYEVGLVTLVLAVRYRMPLWQS